MDNFILCVRNEIYSVLNSLDESYKGIINDFYNPVGKGVRTGFTYYFSNIFGIRKDFSINIATVSELIHLASLLHDDCIDDANYRRNSPTINSKYGITLAILSGDFITTSAFKKANSISCELSLSLVDCVSSMVKGAIIEESVKYKVIDTEKYIEIVNLKTSEIFKWIAFSCGYLSNFNDFEKLKKIAYNFGLSFQIVDDIIDIESERKNIGKDVFKDLIEGKITYPVIIAMEDDLIRKKINDFLNNRSDIGIAYEIRNEILNKSYTKKARDYAIKLVEDIKEDVFNLGDYKKTSEFYGFIYSTVLRNS